MVRSHLEYASSAWYPDNQKLIDLIENVQRRATKQIPTLRNLSYENRLKKLNLPTLVFRRLRGDMIETYKILNNIYDEQVANFLCTKQNTENRYTPRGHNFQLTHQRPNKNIRKHSFSIRITNNWNNLPEQIVNAPNTNTFKNRLDKLLNNQEVKYNYKAALNL